MRHDAHRLDRVPTPGVLDRCIDVFEVVEADQAIERENGLNLIAIADDGLGLGVSGKHRLLGFAAFVAFLPFPAP